LLVNENFPIPPLPEQRAIAAVLSSLDDKIELLREQNKTLEAVAQALYKRWFVEFEFPNEEGKPYKSSGGKMVESELGLIPKGWTVGTVNNVIKRLSMIYRCDKKDLSSKGTTPILDQGSNGIYGYTERNPDFQASMKNPVIIFTNHTCNMWFINYPFCAIQNIIPFRSDKEYSIFFVFYMTVGRVKFTEYKGHWPDFERKKYVIPKPDVTNKFGEIIEPLQWKIWRNISQTRTLSALRDALLPKLISGKIRVSTTPHFGH
jgi:type I restriction enzyme S subunit